MNEPRPADAAAAAPPPAAAPAAQPADTSAEDDLSRAADREEQDPLQTLRASMGLPERQGGTPIDADLQPFLRKAGIFMLALGTGFLALWRVLTWLQPAS